MNAFTLPAKGIQLREKSRKQMIQNLKRVKKTKRIEKAAI